MCHPVIICRVKESENLSRFDSSESKSDINLFTLLFLQAGSADINHVNAAGRTLLSHAVEHGDSTIHTSRLLINHGAMVWPNEGEGTRWVI